MTTTMYLRNAKEIAAAVRAAKRLGYKTSARDIRAHDRYVMNVATRLTAYHYEMLDLSKEIVACVRVVRGEAS